MFKKKQTPSKDGIPQNLFAGMALKGKVNITPGLDLKSHLKTLILVNLSHVMARVSIHKSKS